MVGYDNDRAAEGVLSSETPGAERSLQAAVMAFKKAATLPETLEAFADVKATLGLPADLPPDQIYEALASGIGRRAHALGDLWKALDAKRTDEVYHAAGRCASLSTVVVGGGPAGLRTAIECALLGSHVTVLEKRDNYGRNNQLHLWPVPFCVCLRTGGCGVCVVGRLDRLRVCAVSLAGNGSANLQ